MSESTLTLKGRLQSRDAWQATTCPIAKAMDVIGTRSAFLLMREAFYGTTRFDEFARRVAISEPVAASRLKELVDVGLLRRSPYREPGQRTRDEYLLTEMGEDFFPTLAALMQWGDRWLGESRVQLRHDGCGEGVHVEMRCEEDHRVGVGDISLEERSRSED